MTHESRIESIKTVLQTIKHHIRHEDQEKFVRIITEDDTVGCAQARAYQVKKCVGSGDTSEESHRMPHVRLFGAKSRRIRFDLIVKYMFAVNFV